MTMCLPRPTEQSCMDRPLHADAPPLLMLELSRPKSDYRYNTNFAPHMEGSKESSSFSKHTARPSRLGRPRGLDSIKLPKRTSPVQRRLPHLRFFAYNEQTQKAVLTCHPKHLSICREPRELRRCYQRHLSDKIF